MRFLFCLLEENRAARALPIALRLRRAAPRCLHQSWAETGSATAARGLRVCLWQRQMRCAAWAKAAPRCLEERQVGHRHRQTRRAPPQPRPCGQRTSRERRSGLNAQCAGSIVSTALPSREDTCTSPGGTTSDNTQHLILTWSDPLQRQLRPLLGRRPGAKRARRTR